ncbi:MAG: ATP-grasp domain-containing protein [Deltaproteobacteria bacterium]|nr:ATP-grasp domain-containing protein [Deltaproteobacteria bacterium]
MKRFRRLFIANRGEVAARIARTCDRLGVAPVFGVSEADRDAPYLRGRESVLLGPARSSESYLARERIVQAAVQTRCSALHPGWGFLAEDPLFASLCEAHGVTFIGPPAAVMQKLGRKTPAKASMAAAGLKLIPGSDGVLHGFEQAREVASVIGFPVLLKAESGGGGRGMRIVRKAGEMKAAYESAQSESLACFADGRLYLEKLIEGGRHIEIQLLADKYGKVVHLGERDCSVQRKHQKLIEESPATVLSDAEREQTLAAAVRATSAIGYVGAGTMEFLLDEAGELRFMEMNARLQVEHPVSEMRTGIDLVEGQIRIAGGEPLWFSQKDVLPRGHAIECRINAEDPANGFAPSPGVIDRWDVAFCADEHVRVDTHVESGYEVPPHYDSLICKVIAWGPDRDAACDRLTEALQSIRCDGISTTTPMHLAVLSSEQFRENRYDTSAVPGWES